ncbi:MAG: Cell division protein DivIB [Pelotomaculum sp. PtaB.Bin104]|nr:MAG: Cell division protein DivIB [Pelotomaculum sp. PtaB.Bin104]
MGDIFTGMIRDNEKRKKFNIYESIFWVLIFLVTAFILLRSPIFEVRRILVSGNQFLSEEKIRSVAGVNIGLNIFKLNLSITEGNLKIIPMIREVQVTRVLPSTVHITVTERRPLGLLPTEEGFIEVDGEGVCLQKAGIGTPGLPVITGVIIEQAIPGEILQAERLGEALTVISGLPEEALSMLSEVHVDSDKQIKVYTMEGIQCRLGPAIEIPEKGAVLTQVLQEVLKQGTKISYIDLSCSSMPVVRFK